MDHVNETFDGTIVELDGNTFDKCTFRNVVFHYAGGPVTITECTLDRFSFKFGGALADGLFTLWQLFGTEGMVQIIRGFTEPNSGGEIELRLPERSTERE